MVARGGKVRLSYSNYPPPLFSTNQKQTPVDEPEAGSGSADGGDDEEGDGMTEEQKVFALLKLMVDGGGCVDDAVC